MLAEQYLQLQDVDISHKFGEVTVHGRFQPPIHTNHYLYISNAFKIAERVIILITNPFLAEQTVAQAPHRNNLKNNPFTYEERVYIFESFFKKIGIPKSRYTFKPFDITNEETWRETLVKNTPNLINTYSEWSEEKLKKFLRSGYKVIHSCVTKSSDISGTEVREILTSKLSEKEKRAVLVQRGYMNEAIEGLFEVLNSAKSSSLRRP